MQAPIKLDERNIKWCNDITSNWRTSFVHGSSFALTIHKARPHVRTHTHAQTHAQTNTRTHTRTHVSFNVPVIGIFTNDETGWKIGHEILASVGTGQTVDIFE